MDERSERTVRVPVPRSPMPATLVPSLRGESVVLVNAEGEHYGYVAFTDVWTTAEGHPMVTVVRARQFWMAELLGAVPTERVHVPAGCVFVA